MRSWFQHRFHANRLGGLLLLLWASLTPASSFAQSAPIPFSQEGASNESIVHSTVHIPDRGAPDFTQVELHPPAFQNDDILWMERSTPLHPALISHSSSKATQASTPPHEHFHWGPALLQSFEFLAIEHAFRLADDSYARHLLLHKPFWHDYLASADHFDMSRWGDGDNFLISYIAHPLQGSVASDIFVQNDPGGRSAKFGRSSEYWYSRLKATVWTAAYSAYFEIGPILSEAAIGNEGGYTYIPGCGFYPTCTKEPGRQYKPPTNNTGWVDFVSTPIVGLGWTVLEDAVEVHIVDRLAKGRHTARYDLLRAALTPSRTMANALAFKRPWYRYDDDHPRSAAHKAFYPAAPPPAWKNDPRWDIGVQFTSINLPMDREDCSGCKAFVAGFGFTFAYRPTRFVYLDNEFNVFPGSGSYGQRGGAQEGLFGLKAGGHLRKWGLFGVVRPGFVHYDKALVPGSATDYESTTRFALDLGGLIEYSVSRRSAVRFNFGTTFIHYLTARPDPQQPPVSVLSTDYYVTQGNFQFTTGYVFRF